MLRRASSNASRQVGAGRESSCNVHSAVTERSSRAYFIPLVTASKNDRAPAARTIWMPTVPRASPCGTVISECSGCPVRPVQSATTTVPGRTLCPNTAATVSPKNRRSSSTVMTAATEWSMARSPNGMAAACSARMC